MISVITAIAAGIAASQKIVRTPTPICDISTYTISGPITAPA